MEIVLKEYTLIFAFAVLDGVWGEFSFSLSRVEVNDRLSAAFILLTSA